MTAELQIQKEVFALSNIINLIDEAARTERFLSGPKPPMAASMYNLLETTYMQGDWAYYEKKLLKLRATPKQITRWEFAIECLTRIEKSFLKRKLNSLRENLNILKSDELKSILIEISNIQSSLNNIKFKYDKFNKN